MPNLNEVTQFVLALCPKMKHMGYDPFAIYTQARLETANYTKLPKHNYSGMMPRPDCPYPSERHDTQEFKMINGKNTEITVPGTPFNIYPSVEAYFDDYDLMVSKKFPLMYPDRGNYIKFFCGLMTIKVHPNGEKEAVYPSFCTSVEYAPNLITLYEAWKEMQPDLFQILHGDN